MSENQQQSMEDLNKCSICLKTFQELKILQCQHSFCLCCLQNWMTEKGELECPNCRLSHPVPEGGLQELPSNTTEVETLENMGGGNGNIECCCGKCNVDFYCQDCSQYLCTSCTNYHEIYPPLKSHILQPIPPKALHQPMCTVHGKKLDFFCNICSTPICKECSITEHSDDDGQHEPIKASDAFNDLRVAANALMARADIHKDQAQIEINKCTTNVTNLNKTRTDFMKEINNTLGGIVELVREKEKELEEQLNDIYEEKKEKINSQIDEFKSNISFVEEKQDCITKSMKNGKVTDLQICHHAIEELQGKIAVSPQTEPKNDEQIYFSSTKDQLLSSLEKQGIGSVSEKPTFEIISEKPLTVTCYQTFCIEIAHNNKCEVDIKDLTVTNTTSKTFDPHFEIVRSEEKYFVKGSSNKDCTLDVKFCNFSIRGSPIEIRVERCETIITFQLNYQIMKHESINDLVMSKNGWFVVVGDTHEVFMFENSGAFIGTITLSETSNVQRICKLKNNNLILCDKGNRNITICKQNGHIVKSIQTGLATESLLTGIAVNEDLNLVYVADKTKNCVHVYNMENNLKVGTIGSEGGLGGQMNAPSDVTVTKEGNVIVADTVNHRLQLFGSDGQFIKVLIGGGDDYGMVKEPLRVGVDYDDNIIVASENKVQLFNNCGKFIRVIHQYTNKNRYNPNQNFAFSIVCHFPRRLAIAKLETSEITLVNY